MRGRPAAGIAAILVLSACASPSPSPDGVPPPASDQPAAQECPDLGLLNPSGSAVDLTGAWRANDFGLYNLYQDSSCLYWLGMSQYPGSASGEGWTNVLYAKIQTDYSIAGHWGSVP
jgi:hypothetical protein